MKDLSEIKDGISSYVRESESSNARELAGLAWTKPWINQINIVLLSDVFHDGYISMHFLLYVCVA